LVLRIQPPSRPARRDDQEVEMGKMKVGRSPSAGTILGSIGAVLGLVALVVSLSGMADASLNSKKIHRNDIAPGAVTAKALARGAVRAKAIAKSAVTSRKLAKGAVTQAALAPNAVTSGAIAPGSVYGGALGTVTIHSTPIADVDQIPSNPEWTAGNTEAALCGAGEALLGTGFAFTEPGNREVTWLQVSPFLSPTGNGVTGRFASNSGGTSKGQVMAICLR
jgi:hypothetical protein